MLINRTLKLILLSLVLLGTALSQQTNLQRDTNAIFQPVKPLITPKANSEIRNSWGVDFMISINGFGLGTFYGYNVTDELTGKINFLITAAKDEKEIELYDYWGNPFTPNKVNRFLVFPLLVGIEYRLFKDDIMDNFQPYVSAALGPTIIFSTPYEIEFFNSLKYGRSYYTAGGYLGLGAFFGSERSNVLGINIRYYIIPYSKGIESLYRTQKKEFGGISLSISLGTGW